MELWTYQPMNPTNLFSLVATEWILNGSVPAFIKWKQHVNKKTSIPPLIMPLDERERERQSRTSRSGFDNWTFSTAWSRISRAFSTFPETFQQRFCDSEPKEDKYINFNDDSNHEELEAKKDVSMLSSPNNTGDQVKVLNDSPHTCTNSAFFSYWKAFHKGSEECVHMNK